jgi:hypothetical protein
MDQKAKSFQGITGEVRIILWAFYGSNHFKPVKYIVNLSEIFINLEVNIYPGNLYIVR